MEFLLDRTVSSEKEILELKFRILKNCADRAGGRGDIFSADMVDKIGRYVQEGPFHKSADLQVAFDEM